MYRVSPFVKWIGGKRQLLSHLVEHLPQHYNRYYEPFIGGGALFLSQQPHNAVINDCNRQLINVYRQLKDNAQDVVSCVHMLESEPLSKDRYLYLRSLFNNKIANGVDDVESAGLMIWLNKNGFNGLYRVNSKGYYNVAYKMDDTYVPAMDKNNLLNIGRFLSESNTDIRLGDFENACSDAQAGDFVYFDSPYVPMSKTARFVHYNKDGFDENDHKRLATLFNELTDKGVYIMLSNNDNDTVRQMYSQHTIIPVCARRSVNIDGSNRKGLGVVITNYGDNTLTLF